MGGLLLSPFLQLLFLLAFSMLARRFSMVPGESPTASGAIVMAGGIAVLDALQQVPLPVAPIARLATLGLMTIGGFIAGSYVASWMHGVFHRHTDVPIDSFAIGTWVAGVSVLGQTVLLTLPAWRPFAIVLGMLSLVVWVWFLMVAARGFKAIMPSPMRQNATGRILLATVSTQSLANLAVALLPGELPHRALVVLVVLGYLFYAVGAVLVAERYRPWRAWSLADDWDTTNCILHGAMSISGLAGILTGVISGPWIVATWLWAAGMFLLVEGIEVARARLRVRLYGWREGLFTYHVSQWARNFTFGMFYAFTLHLSLATRDAFPWIAMLRAPIVSYGQYVVLGLLLLETGVFVRANMRLGTRVTGTPRLETRKA